MNRESLDGLKAAFEEWRSRKRYRQQAIPGALLERARRAARRHGPGAVARATRVDRGRLKTGSRSRRERRPAATRVPAFSRVALAAPAVAAQPFAELEMATGVKVRLFTQTDEVLEWLASLCGPGGAR
jgi:hypothetical protein